MADTGISRIDSINSVLDTKAYSTIDTTDTKNAIKVVKALTGAKSLTKSGVTEFVLTDVVFKPNSVIDEVSGEVSEIEDVYLFSDDGEIYYSRSKGIYNSVKMLVAFLPELNVRVRVQTNQASRGTYKQLVPVD